MNKPYQREEGYINVNIYIEITQIQGKKDFKIYLARQWDREKMDAPNAPNPVNPNGQDQFVDAVQGPANQAQGHAVQNQVQGPAPKLKFKVRQLQMLQTTMLKLFKMYLCSHHNNWPQHNKSLLVWWCLPLKYFIKIG